MKIINLQKICVECGKSIKGYGMRCGSCSRKGENNPMYNVHRFGVENPRYIDGRRIIQKHCIDCNIEITNQAVRCLSCAAKITSPLMWDKKGRLPFTTYPLGWNNTFKEQIRYRDAYTCQMCGVPEVECKTKLHVHHIDYIKKNIKEDNLVSLCNACHTKTNHNRQYWISFFNARRG